MDLDIEGDVALVTASNSGLGKASAKALARDGVDVVINDRDETRLEAARREVETVAFLCSARAGNINGQSIVIDGGSGRSNL